MKKLLTLASIAILTTSLTSCANDRENFSQETYSPAQTENMQNARNSQDDVISYEDAIYKTQNDSTLIVYNLEKSIIIKDGVVLPNETQVAGRVIKTVCSKKKLNGDVIAIEHVYDTGYSGYQLTIHGANGGSASTNWNYFPLDCLFIWAMRWQ